MTDGPQGPEWWQAADLKWYPPEERPDYGEALPPPPRSPCNTATARRLDSGRHPATSAGPKARQDTASDSTRQARRADQDRSGRPRGGVPGLWLPPLRKWFTCLTSPDGVAVDSVGNLSIVDGNRVLKLPGG
jgi:hypothetical protein